MDLDIFLDVNVYLDAFIAWGDDMRPTVLVTETGNISGDPACAVLQAICEGRIVNGSRLVLHSSERVLMLVHAKLTDPYRWSAEKANEAVDWIIATVDASSGRIIREADEFAVEAVPGLRDVEDLHRLAEARASGATLILTRDQGILDSVDARRMPLPLKPRAFVDRIRDSR